MVAFIAELHARDGRDTSIRKACATLRRW